MLPLRHLDLRSIALSILILTAVMELITVFMRFGAGLESTRDTPWIGRLTFGVRIHHGYVGVVLLVIGVPFLREAGWRNAVGIVGCSLALSDLVHHFVVLWWTTGSPQFDLFYPSRLR